MILALILMIANTLFRLRELKKTELFERGLFALHTCLRMPSPFLANYLKRFSVQEVEALRSVGSILEDTVRKYRAGRVITYSACEELKEAFEIV